jgi:hypothetical protein
MGCLFPGSTSTTLQRRSCFQYWCHYQHQTFKNLADKSSAYTPGRDYHSETRVSIREPDQSPPYPCDSFESPTEARILSTTDCRCGSLNRPSINPLSVSNHVLTLFYHPSWNALEAQEGHWLGRRHGWVLPRVRDAPPTLDTAVCVWSDFVLKHATSGQFDAYCQ